MSKSVNPIPSGFRTVTPHLMVKGAAQAIDFYKKAFGAKEIMRMPGPDGQSVMHGEIQIGDSIIMLGDEFPGTSGRSPQSAGTTTVGIHLYVEDVDKAYNQAVASGCKAIMPPMDMFWGDRFGKLADPFGHEWSLATHVEDVPPDEMCKRGQAAMAQFAAK